MTDAPSPSVEARELWRITNEAALALVDEHLGPPSAWDASALMAYRLEADFQADWKAEVGHWLHAAKAHGALDKFLKPLLGERERKTRNEERDGNDPRHLKLHQHLGAAMVCHYFTGLGWSCVGFDTETGGQIDIDLALNAPDGTLVEFQVKVCDQPGRLQDGQYVQGDYDDRVLQALDKAVGQLPQPARSVELIALYAQRSFSLTQKPTCVIKRVFGRTIQTDTGVFLERAEFGRFFGDDWKHIAGIVLLDLLRGADFEQSGDEVRLVDVTKYPCTVLLNPRAERPAEPDWFPRARVAMLEGHAFRWIRGQPTDRHGLPTGTRVVDELPER